LIRKKKVGGGRQFVKKEKKTNLCSAEVHNAGKKGIDGKVKKTGDKTDGNRNEGRKSGEIISCHLVLWGGKKGWAGENRNRKG